MPVPILREIKEKSDLSQAEITSLIKDQIKYTETQDESVRRF